MIIPGYRYTLTIDRIDPKGAWLRDLESEVLLPHRECVGSMVPGGEIEVFIYLDRNGQQTATTRMPYAQMDEFAMLKVQSVGEHGAFLDWGVAKDLLCPFAEQYKRMLEGRRYLVRICHDSQQRPIASSKLDQFLSKENEDLEEGEQVEMLLWAYTDLGAKMIVNNYYEAVLYQSDIPPGLKAGDRINGYVVRIRPDRRIDVGLSRPGRSGVEDAKDNLLAILQTQKYLPLNDQSSPELIRDRLGMSKKQFKKAIGGLYKEGKLKLEDDGIRLVE